MALATKCPQCGAFFRVVADQLKLRGGLVRCGQCRSVFDAIGSLTYVDDSALPQPKAAGRPAPVGSARPTADDNAAGTPTRQPLGRSTTLRISPVPPATLAGIVPPGIPQTSRSTTRDRPPESPGRDTTPDAGDNTSEEAPEEVVPRDDVPTLLDRGGAAAPGDAEVPTPVSPVSQQPTVEEAPDGEPPLPMPATPFAWRRRGAPRGFSIVYGGGSALLAVLAAVQLAVIFRGELMVRWPQFQPVLAGMCVPFGCTVGWPTRADQLAVIGSELQSIPGTSVLELTAVVRNRAGYRQSLPAVEVTLTDASNRALARKVFTPADYLSSAGEPSSRIDEGLAAGQDHTIRVLFEARGLQPVGFLVYPFYL